MKISIFLFLFVTAELCDCRYYRAQEPNANDDVEVSAKCAAVLLASTTTLGAGVAYVTPALLCGAGGFCATGVAGNSFASWWQSTMPNVVKGSLFAQLQSMAMGGIGASFTVAVATVGGVSGATYLRDFCTFVDKTDPESAMGLVFATSVTVVTTAIETKQKVQRQCASSATCTSAVETMSEVGASAINTMSEVGASAVETISSAWDSFATGASRVAKLSYLRLQIINQEDDIKTQKLQFAAHVFDYIRSKSGLTWDSTELKNRYMNSIEKVRALEAQIMEEELKGFSAGSLKRKLDKQKDEFGAGVFDIFKNQMDVTNTKLDEIFIASAEIINAIELLIQDKKAQLAELA